MRRLVGLVVCMTLAAAPVGAQSETGQAEAAPIAPEALRLSAEPIASLPATPVALAPYAGGTAALLTDGRLVTIGATGTRTLQQGLDGEMLVPCDGRLVVLRASGRIASVTVGRADLAATGPAVSLHATPACLSDGTWVALDPEGRSLLHLDTNLELLGRTELAMLPDAAPTVLDGDLVAVLIGPTLRYRHGVLGDEVEASGVAIVDPNAGRVVAEWRALDDRVVEDRRAVAFPAAGRWGTVVTVSGAGDGGALVVLAAEPDSAPTLASRAVASGLGQERGQRWRHVLGSVDDRLYAVAAPHLGGPLERWTLPPEGGVLEREAYDLGISSHLEGRRDLTLGRLVPSAPVDPADLDLLLLPTLDLTALRLVACDAAACRTLATVDLGGRISASPRIDRRPDGDLEVVAGREDGALMHVRVPHDRILTNSE